MNVLACQVPVRMADVSILWDPIVASATKDTKLISLGRDALVGLIGFVLS